MNTNFIDIASTISNLVQSGVSRADSMDGTPLASRGQGFEDRYQQEINRLQSTENRGADVTLPVREKARGEQVASVVSDTVETMEDSTGGAFLSKFAQVLRQISGGDLKGLFMDANGLDALKKLLLKAGFDPDEVEGLIADLKEKSASKTLSLDEVMDALSDLVVEVDEKATTDAVYLETSALPFIKTLLGQMGLGEEEIADVVEAAEEGGEGFNLDVLIEKLKAVEATYRESGRTLGVEDAEGSFKGLMSQLNLPVGGETEDVVTINDLIRAFEDYNAQKQAQTEAASELAQKAASDSESATALLNKLFQSFSMDTETQSLGFSFQQVKDQFLNEMMLPSKEKAGHQGLFAQQTTGKDGQTDALIKEMAALLSKGESGEGKSSSGGERLGAGFGKELKSELSKGEAMFHGSSGTNGDLDGPGSASRAAKAAPRTLPGFLTQQVGRGIARAVNQGESSLTLQLKPAELGRLTMTIDHQSTGVKVHIVTENQSARDLLASNVNELKAALSSAGISLDSFDVDMNSDFRQSMADAGNQAGGRKNGSRQGRGGTAKESEMAGEIAAAAAELVTDGSYHFVA